MITGLPYLKSITPDKGSTNGGTKVTVLGNGFSNSTIVKLGGSGCIITSYTVYKLNCITTAHSAETVSVDITDGNVVYDSNGVKFTFDLNLTPAISSVNPTSEAYLNSLLTITGTGFSLDKSNFI